MSEHERDIENKAIREKDAELLRKLRESLKLKPDEPIPDNIAEKLKASIKKDK